MNPVSENVVGPTIVGDARQQWLAERRSKITASDAAAILGRDPRRGPLSVWAEKIGALEPADAPWMRRGRRFEAPIAEEYAEETGRPVYAPDPYAIRIHPDIPWLGATLDRETEGCEASPAPAAGRGPLELKNVSGLKAKEWRAEPPPHYLIQVQVQIACTGAEWASLAALIGGLSIAWVDVPRHDRFIAAMLPKLEEFRWYVEKREPPPVTDALPSTSAVLAALYAAEDGETVELDREAQDLADELDAARLDRRAAMTRERAAANKLKSRLAAASFGKLPDGSYLYLTSVEREAYEVAETSYRQLSRRWPRIPRRT